MSRYLNSFKAEVDQKTNNMKAVGNVIAISDSGITLIPIHFIGMQKMKK